MTGHGRPLTRMTSPEGAAVPAVVEAQLAVLTERHVGHDQRDVELALGSSARSTLSWRWYCATRPEKTFWAVWWTPWSWYHRVRAGWKFG